MNYKRIILISLMVLVLSLTAVSAADIDNTILAESSDADDSFVESLEIQDSEKLSALPGNFHELQMEVINAPSGSVLNLTQDYNGENGLVVTVNKDLTIDGQGHTINCLDKKGCFAFTSDSGTIILKNLNIINGKNDGNIPLDDNYKGGAIKISGSARYIIDNCTFKDNFADDYGGAIYHESNKPLTIKNCQFISNKADDQDGGAIYSTGELIIENSIFSDNKVKNTDRARGGAIYCKGKTTITGSLFVNNYGDDYGGAIYNGANNPLTIKNCQFIDNEAADFDGGAIYSLGNVIVEDSVFMDNSAEDRGGAIFTEQCVNVTNSLFQSNKVDDSHGGAIYSPGKVNVVGSTFKSNKAHWYGGAIRSSEEVTVVNSTFEDNNGDQGGAIYTLRNVNVNVNQDPSGPFSSFFINNDADDLDGGAIYSDNARVVNAVFSGNSANEDGGAILACSDAHVTHCLFESNKADGAAIMQCYGGAIYAKDDISVDNCTFKDNYANDYGGAIYGDTIKINYNSGTQPFSSFFINNKVKDNDGGAVYAYYDLYALNCVFSGNTAYEDGGAIFCCDNAYLAHCLFENNKGDGADYAQNEGGAIHCKDDLTVDNCTFRNNFAYDYGGAIYADTLELKQTPSYFEYNTAKDNQGGAIWVNKFRKDVKYATFIGNRVNANDDGGAIYIDNKNKITFSDCVFIKNHCGDEGGAIYLDSSSSYLTLKNNIFIDNSAGDQGDSVFNCGHYDTVSGNFWGGKNPSKSNSQLIEWHPAPLSNEHHTDKNPLSIKFELDEDCSLVNEIVTGLVSLYNSDGSYFIDPYIYMIIYFLINLLQALNLLAKVLM
ncbi:hypothetical protein TL18_10405 [Methanobrevibacter sp. YE315]|uniref:right-handed parallel beta-helix repeat-containing protein n=1 Tax=Methanobrevibacter sp. YE315 TaxID=1609968 RepID=UPI000764E5A4|nr:right-handed parallel beta-helix repeat-containing protein [Methanobrevibacter sp. YE315]AMD18381.1 hypothetical protein TL18_10405 [Methanobrevibacter sp. YE315]